MKHNWKSGRLALLAALALMLILPSGCAGDQNGAAQPSDSAAVSAGQEDGADLPEVSPEKTPDAEKPQEGEPEGTEPESAASESTAPEETKPEENKPEEPKPEEVKPEEPKPEESAPSEEPAPASDVLADGTYTAAVTLGGGTGRAKVNSPASLRVEDGAVWATITWSSSNYDYMKVDGEKYLPLSIEGGAVFEIPVAGFDCDLPVVADTTAMSTPHEIEYTLCFDSSSLQSAS